MNTLSNIKDSGGSNLDLDEVSSEVISEFIEEYSTGTIGASHQKIEKMLQAIRKYLGMDVAFLSEFAEGRRLFRYVDSADPKSPVQVGGSDPLEESYCQRVVDGRLPQLMQDASEFAAARELPVTRELPVGAHLSVPIKLKDGQVFGTFCCFSYEPDRSLNRRDLSMMKVFADFAADLVEEDLETYKENSAARERINAVLSGDVLSMFYQPIYRLSRNEIVGFESLARFATTPVRTPDVWFSEAAQVGLGTTLELLAIQKALMGIDQFPGGAYVSVNTSPDTILDEQFESTLSEWPLDRVVLELTEHTAVEYYEDIKGVLEPLRSKGLRVAIDDAGAGYASFRHILQLDPDIIKLDMSITQGIESDLSRRALAAAFVSFARTTDSKLVAEGVESASELSVLREFGINKAQGYYLAKPMPLEDARSLIHAGP